MSEKPSVIFIAVGGQGNLENKEIAVPFEQAQALLQHKATIFPIEELRFILNLAWDVDYLTDEIRQRLESVENIIKANQ